jgi:cysteine desulfurase
MGVPAETAQGSLIFTLGTENTDADVDLALKVLPPVVARLRQISPLWAAHLRNSK